MTRYGMAIDMDHCIGCQTCVVSCQLNNALRPGTSRNSVDMLEWGRWPEGDLAFFAHACIHCESPLCVDVCPTGASKKRDDGIVVVDHELCIGCGVCVTACEYGARSINVRDGFHYGENSPAPYEAKGMQPINVADKCTFCFKRIDDGLQPACVSDCIAGVRAFGDLDDPASPVNAFIAERGCTPVPGSSLYYGFGTRNLDAKALITENYYRSAKADRERQETEAPPFNPAVVGTAAVAAAATATALGVSAKRSRAKRKTGGQGKTRARDARN